jgi:hypothetical protein
MRYQPYTFAFHISFFSYLQFDCFLLFYCLLSKFFFRPFSLFFLSVLLSFLLLSNWFFLSSFVFPLLFQHCFIPVSLAHVVSSLAYPNLLGTDSGEGLPRNWMILLDHRRLQYIWEEPLGVAGG